MNKLILALLSVTTIASAAVPANADNANIQNITTTIKVEGTRINVRSQPVQTIDNKNTERTPRNSGNSQAIDTYTGVSGTGISVTEKPKQTIINGSLPPRRNRR